MAPGVGPCPICLDILEMPAALRCGHVFCFTCIEQHHAATRRPSCPSCRATTSEKPVKLFFSEESKPRRKTWAEATIPTPLFAELHVKNLREDLSAAQAKHETARRELESALIENRSLSSQNRRIISERDKAVRERDSLLRDKEIYYLKEKESLVAAGLRLETTVAALRTEASELRGELLRASTVIRELEIEKRARETRNQVAREIPPTITNTSGTVHGSIRAQAMERSRETDMGSYTNPLTVSSPGGAGPPPPTRSATASLAVALDRDLPPLPSSMSLDEILAGGLRKYMPARSRTPTHHT